MAWDLAPRALIVSTRDWFGAARLVEPLSRAGFHVGSLNFPGGLITYSSFLKQSFVLPTGATDTEQISSAISAMREFKPKLIIPGDDPAVVFLHAIAAELRSEPEAELASALRESLGDPRFYAAVQNRQRTHAVAQGLGLRVPEARAVETIDDVAKFAEEHGTPYVLKAEGSCAGFGVAICSDLEAAGKAMNTFKLWYSQAREPGNILAQRFIRGKTAMRATSAWQGRVLAGLSALKVEVNPNPTGPSSVVEFIDHAEMTNTVEALVKALGVSGFSSADFIIEDDTNRAYLLELNPRPVPICHLGGRFGPDLCAPLLSAVKGEAIELESGSPLREERTVALFPQEWVRNPRSPYLSQAFHDVPWHDPKLVEWLMTYSSSYFRRDEGRREDGNRERFRARAYGETSRG